MVELDANLHILSRAFFPEKLPKTKQNKTKKPKTAATRSPTLRGETALMDLIRCSVDKSVYKSRQPLWLWVDGEASEMLVFQWETDSAAGWGWGLGKWILRLPIEMVISFQFTESAFVVIHVISSQACPHLWCFAPTDFQKRKFKGSCITCAAPLLTHCQESLTFLQEATFI